MKALAEIIVGRHYLLFQSTAFSTFESVRNNSMTSRKGGLEISLSGFELAWKSVVFRVFPAVIQ